MDDLHGEEDLGYMLNNLAPWVVQKIKQRTAEADIKVPNGYKLKLYRDDTFTLSHHDIILIFKY